MRNNILLSILEIYNDIIVRPSIKLVAETNRRDFLNSILLLLDFQISLPNKWTRNTVTEDFYRQEIVIFTAQKNVFALSLDMMCQRTTPFCQLLEIA